MVEITTDELKLLSKNISVVLHGKLALLVPIKYKKEFNLTKWVNEKLTEQEIIDWVKNKSMEV